MRKGFTLIEVLVTIAILAILAGTLLPATWKWQETQDIQATKEKLNQLKMAMVGDKSLMQNGIRTSYGFVGDFGELPVQGQLSSIPLKSYISGGATPEAYQDSWRRNFIYTAYDNLPGYDGRYLSGRICSAGPDGKSGTADDICVDIPLSDVAPTHRIQGNFVFSGISSSIQSARFFVTFKNPNDPSGESLEMPSACKEKGAASFPNFTTLFNSAASPRNLPIGKISLSAKGYAASGCSGSPAGTSGTMDYFVTDNLSRLFVNLPAIQ